MDEPSASSSSLSQRTGFFDKVPDRLTSDEEEEDEEQAPPPDEKEAVSPPDQDFIRLKAVSQDGQEVVFKIRHETPLKKLMEAYCKNRGLAPAQIRFLYDGERIQGSSTPESLEMEEGDIIDVVLQQTGGF